MFVNETPSVSSLLWNINIDEPGSQYWLSERIEPGMSTQRPEA